MTASEQQAIGRENGNITAQYAALAYWTILFSRDVEACTHYIHYLNYVTKIDHNNNHFVANKSLSFNYIGQQLSIFSARRIARQMFLSLRCPATFLAFNIAADSRHSSKAMLQNSAVEGKKSSKHTHAGEHRFLFKRRSRLFGSLSLLDASRYLKRE